MEIRKISEEDDTISKLYEASMEGSVNSLNSLIQENPLILSKISLTTFSETPLHISALLGHLHFTKQLLSLQPMLASQLDSRRRSPLHLASASGHVEIVRELLQRNDMCMARDDGGRIPLHYAAMRGHVGVIELLIAARPDSIFEALPDGETVLHLCVQYNHMEALKLFVESVGCDNAEFFNMKEHANGNTILHLAVMLKQVETVKYLLSVPGVKEDTLNNKGYTASDMVDQLQRDFNSLKLRFVLKDKRQSAICGVIEDQERPTEVLQPKAQPKLPPSNCLLACWQIISQILIVLNQIATGWLHGDQMRGSIVVVATLIAQMTFQTAMTPPGGVWQQSMVTPDVSGELDINCSKEEPCIIGTAVMAYVWSEDYVVFMKYNSIAFVASLSVILLVVAGIPLSNSFCLWIMNIAMCITLTFMALTFLQGMNLVTPNTEIYMSVGKIMQTVAIIWLSMLGFVALFHTVLILILLVKKWRRNRLLRSVCNRFRSCWTTITAMNNSSSNTTIELVTTRQL